MLQTFLKFAAASGSKDEVATVVSALMEALGMDVSAAVDSWEEASQLYPKTDGGAAPPEGASSAVAGDGSQWQDAAQGALQQALEEAPATGEGGEPQRRKQVEKQGGRKQAGRKQR